MTFALIFVGVFAGAAILALVFAKCPHEAVVPWSDGRDIYLRCYACGERRPPSQPCVDSIAAHREDRSMIGEKVDDD